MSSRRRRARETAEIPRGIGGVSPFPERGSIVALRFLSRGFEVALDPDKAELIVGRDYPPTVDVHLPFDSISRQHAQFSRRPTSKSAIFVKDLDSKNGIAWERAGGREFERDSQLLVNIGTRFKIGDVRVMCLDEDLYRLAKPISRYCRPDAFADVDAVLSATAYWRPLVFRTYEPDEAEVLARLLHDGTARRERPFTVVSDVPSTKREIDAFLTKADCGTVFLNVSGRKRLPKYFVHRLFSTHYHLWPIIVTDEQESVSKCIHRHMHSLPAGVSWDPWRERGEVQVFGLPRPPPERRLDEPFATIARVIDGDATRAEGLLPWQGWLGLCVLRALAVQRRLHAQLVEIVGHSFELSVFDRPMPELPGWRFRTADSWLAGEHDDGDRAAIPWFSYASPNHLPPPPARRRRKPPEPPPRPDHAQFSTFSSSHWIHWSVGHRVQGLMLGERASDADEWKAVCAQPRLAASLSGAPSSFPEARLWRWLPSARMISMLSAQIFGMGGGIDSQSWCVPLGGQLRLDPLAEGLVDVVASLNFADPLVQSAWAEAFGDTEVAGTAEDVMQLRARYRDWVDGLVRTPGGSDSRGEGLDLGIDLVSFLPAVLEGAELVWAYDVIIENNESAAGFVINEVRRNPGLPRLTSVSARLRGLSPPAGDAFTVLAAARYLFERGEDLELARAKLVEFATQELDPVASMSMLLPGEFVIALLELAPEAALPAVRAHLRCDDEATVTHVAAALVSIGSPWCRRELMAAYSEAAPCWQTVRVALGKLGATPQVQPGAAPRTGLEIPPKLWADFDAVLASLAGIRWPRGASRFDEA